MNVAVSIAFGLSVAMLVLGIVAESDRQRKLRAFGRIASVSGVEHIETQSESNLDWLIARFQAFENLTQNRFGLLRLLNDRLFSANLKIRIVPLIMFSALLSLAVGAIFTLIGLPITAVFILALVVQPIMIWQLVERRISKKRIEFQEQIPEFLLLLASSLRSGLSLLQGLDSVSSQGDGEVERQFRRMVRELSLGLSLETSLEALRIRTRSSEMPLLIATLQTQREIGGNLSPALETTAKTLRERLEIAQEIRVLSAEGRFSAIFLTILPIAVFAFFFVFNPSYVEVFWTEAIGAILGIIFVCLIGIGALWIRVLVRIRV